MKARRLTVSERRLRAEAAAQRRAEFRRRLAAIPITTDDEADAAARLLDAEGAIELARRGGEAGRKNRRTLKLAPHFDALYRDNPGIRTHAFRRKQVQRAIDNAANPDDREVLAEILNLRERTFAWHWSAAKKRGGG
jgi:hypothetical protein